MRREPVPSTTRIIIPVKALDTVFDECDRHQVDETGGRLIGTYTRSATDLTIIVQGIIEPGAHARRSNTSFFQDGDYQESIFRDIERSHPQVEHLGNWHTHHVNGFPSLSGGDVQTYQRIVNHDQHNTSFFYALLVTAKGSGRGHDRYQIKHYVLQRGDPRVYEIGHQNVTISHAPLLWPTDQAAAEKVPRTRPSEPGVVSSKTERVHDRIVLRDFYAQLRSFTSRKVGFYWRGPIELSDGSETEVVVIEDADGCKATYAIGLPKPDGRLKSVAAELDARRFSSARAALIHAERACNRELFLSASQAPISSK